VSREKIPQANHVNANHREQHVRTTLKGETNVNFMEWLTRSIVYESKKPRDLEILSRTLVKDVYSKIYALSKFKFILIYCTIQTNERTMKTRGS